MRWDKNKKAKTLMALAFVSSVLASELPAMSEDQSESSDVFIREVVDDGSLSPEIRTYYLLVFADLYIDNKPLNRHEMSNWRNAMNFASRPRFSDRETSSADWASRFSKFAGLYDAISPKVQPKPSTANSALAIEALGLAVKELAKTPDPRSQLAMYFLAAGMYRKLGHMKESAECEAILNSGLKLCEIDSSVKEARIKSAAAILNSMACNIIYVQIPDLEQTAAATEKIPSFSAKEFAESEKLRLRAVKILDRLDSKNQMRWRGHRDLALWYKSLGKAELADKQKQILFDLVGINDDRIMYPHRGGCGRLVWWQVVAPQVHYLCGMG